MERTVGRTTLKLGITIKTAEELDLMRHAGRIVASVLTMLAQAARPGVSTAELDQIAEDAVRAAGALPSFKGYREFPASICASINEEIVHGIPSPNRVLCEGDILSIDFGAIYQGWQGDAALTVGMGKISPQAERLVRVTRESLQKAIEQARPGNRVTDIGAAVETHARRHGYQVVREYCGHGIGRNMHEEPPVPNFGPAGQGPVLKPGMTLAIEPMLSAGTYKTRLEADGWTVRTADRKLSAHFEHTVAITDHGPEILTRRDGKL